MIPFGEYKENYYQTRNLLKKEEKKNEIVEKIFECITTGVGLPAVINNLCQNTAQE